MQKVRPLNCLNQELIFVFKSGTNQQDKKRQEYCAESFFYVKNSRNSVFFFSFPTIEKNILFNPIPKFRTVYVYVYLGVSMTRVDSKKKTMIIHIINCASKGKKKIKS